ncbi:cupin domain-containing protein [Acidaminobacter sp. JC074]|uniref:cupin domain-containing protein n=1 Tax=Acidaminobacter sp. JC074 TaxID=2530199 RepID=UPI001F0D5B6E|nr:cupin domain-containing protein [Acidaminobacter sp. JC074]MCH4886102.1 cupin domain-containing protein [Acidaminobacter sp. JC074]
MKKADYWIKNLDMVSHPEGGYYHVTYASPHRIEADAINSDFKGSRALASSIYFLIEEGNVSNFHRLKSDEIWYFHEGEPLTIAMIHKDGTYESVRLGLDIEEDERPQIIVPAGTIFGSYPEKGYALVSCMVSYAFEFEDFELFRRQDLLDQYPQHEDIIKRLTRG